MAFSGWPRPPEDGLKTQSTPDSIHRSPVTETVTQDRKYNETVAVRNRAGELLFWARGAQAQRLVNDGRARPLGTKRKVHAIEVETRDDARLLQVSAYVGQRYSHRRETAENPHGVWMLRRLSGETKSIFGAVVNDCASTG